MAANWFKSRQGKYTGYVVAYILVVVAVLAAVNFLANRYDKSYDATSNKQFSLSDQTIKLVKGLKSDLRLTYFGETSGFPGARDLLDRYASLSPKLHVTYLDPVRKPQQAKSAGFRSDSPVVVENGPKREGAKSLTEEEITGAIIRAEKTGERNVCFLSAGGEHSIDDSETAGYSIAKQLVERDNYKTRTRDAEGRRAGGRQDGQRGAGPRGRIVRNSQGLHRAGDRRARRRPTRRRWSMPSRLTWKAAAARCSCWTTRCASAAAEPPAENPDLVKLLADWGVTVNKDLVLDLSGIGGIFGLGPEVPAGSAIRIASHHPAAYPRAHGVSDSALARSEKRRQDHRARRSSPPRRTAWP